MKRKKTWVLVADAGHARVFDRSPEKTLVQVLDFKHATPKSSDLVRDGLPRTFDSAGPGRHAIAPKSDPHRTEKRKFAEALAEKLDASHAAKAFDELIIVAPPQMIGDLRPNLSDAVKRCLRHEVQLDLVDAPIPDITRHLAAAGVV